MVPLPKHTLCTAIFSFVVSKHFSHVCTYVRETSLLKIRTAFVHKGANSCLFFDTNHSKHGLPNLNHIDRSPTLVLSLYNVSCLFRVTTLQADVSSNTSVEKHLLQCNCLGCSSVHILQEAFIYPL